MQGRILGVRWAKKGRFVTWLSMVLVTENVHRNKWKFKLPTSIWTEKFRRVRLSSTMHVWKLHLARMRRMKSKAYQQTTQRWGYQGIIHFARESVNTTEEIDQHMLKIVTHAERKGILKLSRLYRGSAAPIRSARRWRSNFRGRGHGHPKHVYYAEDTPTRELGEMFDQCTVQDVWVAKMGGYQWQKQRVESHL